MALLAAALAVVVFTGASTPTMAGMSQDYASDIASGPADAAVALVEYADFECSACAGYAPALTTLRAEHHDDVLFVFRFFPLENHRYGLISAQAAYAAFLQDKFWEMHDLLYERQEEWSGDDDPRTLFEAYAAYLELDVDTFRKDMEAASTTEFIIDQKSEAAAAGVNHTPWYVIDGDVVSPDDYDDLGSLIAERL